MEIKTNVTYSKSVRCSDVYTESQTDYVLPDYMSDMRKILFTDASLRPSGRFAGGDQVEFSGIVVYNVIYLDSDGEISSVEFSSDYDYSLKCSGDGYGDSIADTRVPNYAVRLVGPRKISAKASLAGSVRLSENCSLSVSGNAFDGDASPEINTGSIKMRSTGISSVVEREYAEPLTRLDGAIADEVRVIYPSAEVMVDDIVSDGESVTMKGKLRMRAIIKNADEVACGVEKLVGFEENLDFDGAEALVGFVPKLSVCSVKTSVNADESGCEIVMSVILELCALGEGNQSVDVVFDGYLKDAPTDTSYENMQYSRLVDTRSLRTTHSAEISRADIESEGLREVIFLTSTPKVEQVECENGRVTIEGEVRYSGVASEMVGDKISYTYVKFSAPFTINSDVECENSDNLHVEVELKSSGASASLDEDRLYATCTLDCVVMAVEDSSCRILSSMSRREGESFASSKSVVTVYYPSDEDTLFSVAKRFHTSGLKVARDNDISDAVFAADNPSGKLVGVKKLFIY